MKGKKNTKTLNCKICGEEVKNVGSEAEKVTCWKCVNKMMSSSYIPLADEGENDK